MEKFTTLTAVAAPLPMINVDTDMIIPKQFLKTIKRTGLGSALFHLSRTGGDSRKLFRSLALRVGLSVGLFILLMVAWALGLITPHGL